MDEKRNLTEADVDAILEAFEARFYSNIGKGLWKLVLHGVILALLAIAGYGALHR